MCRVDMAIISDKQVALVSDELASMEVTGLLPGKGSCPLSSQGQPSQSEQQISASSQQLVVESWRFYYADERFDMDTSCTQVARAILRTGNAQTCSICCCLRPADGLLTPLWRIVISRRSYRPPWLLRLSPNGVGLRFRCPQCRGFEIRFSGLEEPIFRFRGFQLARPDCRS